MSTTRADTVARAGLPTGDVRPGRIGVDGVTLLTIWLFLLLAVPSRLVFAPLGGAGTPAILVGVVGTLLWCWYHLHRATPVPRGGSRVRRMILAFFFVVLVSYAGAMARPIVQAEVSTADLALVSLVGWVGVALVAHDGINDRGRLETLVRRIAVGGGSVALLGVAQFITHQPLIDHIDFPGLTTNAQLISVLGRQGFSRPAGTALHPIEFGVMLTIVLPFALHRAFYSPDLGRLRRWWPAMAIAAAIPLSISRSALLGSATVLLILVPTWPRARRRLTLAFLLALFGVIFVLVPGMLGTLTGLFTGIGQDSSAKSRTDSYGLALEFVARSPLIGRGMGTFLPSYRILDNQYLLLLIETGIAGVVALLTVLVTAFRTARRARRLSTLATDRDLAQCVAAAVAAAAVSLALFDALSFPMAAGLLFLVVGMAGALPRLMQPAATAPSEGGRL
jgi:O-antigen ligase